MFETYFKHLKLIQQFEGTLRFIPKVDKRKKFRRTTEDQAHLFFGEVGEGAKALWTMREYKHENIIG